MILHSTIILQRGRLNELRLNVGEAIACYESTLSIHPNHKAAKQRVVSFFCWCCCYFKLHTVASKKVGDKKTRTTGLVEFFFHSPFLTLYDPLTV